MVHASCIPSNKSLESQVAEILFRREGSPAEPNDTRICDVTGVFCMQTFSLRTEGSVPCLDEAAPLAFESDSASSKYGKIRRFCPVLESLAHLSQKYCMGWT